MMRQGYSFSNCTDLISVYMQADRSILKLISQHWPFCSSLVRRAGHSYLVFCMLLLHVCKASNACASKRDFADQLGPKILPAKPLPLHRLQDAA